MLRPLIGSVFLAFAALLLLQGSGKKTLHPYPFPELPLFPKMPFAAENPVTIEGAALGRYLFYDPILSADSSMACASCHKHAAAFSDAPLALSKGRNSVLMQRNTPPLFNLAWYPAMFWDGRAGNIELQIFHPVRGYSEMNLSWLLAEERLRRSRFYQVQFRNVFGDEAIDSMHIARAIGQFLRTLISYESKYDQVIKGQVLFTKDEYQGLILANDQTKGDCIHCHITDGDALATNLIFSNNGLDNGPPGEKYQDRGRGEITGNTHDDGKFKVPSLRNLAFTAPFMHDGRFKTLDEVIDFYSEGVHPGGNTDSKMGYAKGGGVHLSVIEKRQLKAFLLTLSDSSFVKKKEFGNPWVR